jgi:hypothetical protein
MAVEPNEYPFAIVRGVIPSLINFPLVTVRGPLPSALSLPREREPVPVTVVPPLNVFAPLNVSLPSFAFVNDPLPPITPLRMTAEPSTLTVFAPLRVVFAVNVNAPVPYPPKIAVEPNEYPFAIVRGVVPSLRILPPVTETRPVPRLASFPTNN